MKIKELEDLGKLLDNIIIKAKNSKKSKNIIDIEKMALHRYQVFIVGSISFRQNAITKFSCKCSEKERLESELKQYLFIKDTIRIFIENDLEDERDKINLI